jgi:hypothetical protein
MYSSAKGDYHRFSASKEAVMSLSEIIMLTI